MKYTFKGGSTVEGTLDQIMTVAAALGETVVLSKVSGITSIPKGYYNSSTKGLQAIKDMNAAHIKNALLKRARDYYESLVSFNIGTQSKKTDFLQAFTSMVNDTQIQDLYTELAKR